jgi:hypothetical protein
MNFHTWEEIFVRGYELLHLGMKLFPQIQR